MNARSIKLHGDLLPDGRIYCHHCRSDHLPERFAACLGATNFETLLRRSLLLYFEDIVRGAPRRPNRHPALVARLIRELKP